MHCALTEVGHEEIKPTTRDIFQKPWATGRVNFSQYLDAPRHTIDLGRRGLLVTLWYRSREYGDRRIPISVMYSLHHGPLLPPISPTSRTQHLKASASRGTSPQGKRHLLIHSKTVAIVDLKYTIATVLDWIGRRRFPCRNMSLMIR